MRQFSGCEPLVGEVVGLRTFRVEESGLLLPLYSNLAWYDGANTASCAPPTGDHQRDDHPVPAPDCECGFYAYGTIEAASHNRHARYVQAVVACWGGVVAGTQGFRAQHARIEAVWLHRNVPAWIRRRVAAMYPSVAVYTDRAAMLAEHPLSILDCYQPAPRPKVLPRAATAVGVGAVFGLGLVPGSLLRSSTALWSLWLSTTICVGLLGFWLLVGARSPGHRAAAMVTAGVLAWLLAPLFGLTGWLLRAPVLRGLLVAGGEYLLSLRPGFFPLVHAERERAFCGVRA